MPAIIDYKTDKTSLKANYKKLKMTGDIESKTSVKSTRIS